MALAGSAVAAPLAAPTLEKYVVKSGDSCASIARVRFGSSKRVDLLHAYNSLGPAPHHLAPGQILNLPRLAALDAKLSWVRNLVHTFTPDENEGHREDPLKRGDKVGAGTASNAELTFNDYSRLAIGEQTLIVVYGEAKATATAEPETTLLSGGLRAFLESAAQPAVAIRTPAGRVQVGAGEALVGVDSKRTTRLAVHRGRSKLAAAGREVAVDEGFGSKAEEGKPPTPPRPLPMAPEWAAAPHVLLGGDAQDFAVDLNVDANAAVAPASWRFQVARDERFNDLLLDAVVPSTVKRFEARQLPPGEYLARVSAIDHDSFEGKFGKVMRFRVVRIGVVVAGDRRARVELPDGVTCTLDGAAVASGVELETDREHRLVCAAPLGSIRVAGAMTIPATAAPPPPPAPPVAPVAPPPVVEPPKAEPAARLSLEVSAAGDLVVARQPLHVGGGGTIAAGLRVRLPRGAFSTGLEGSLQKVGALTPETGGVYATYHFEIGRARVNPYVTLGAFGTRLAASAGNGGSRSYFGMKFALGIEARLGPGAVDLGVAYRDFFTSGGASDLPGGVVVSLGYRFLAW